MVLKVLLQEVGVEVQAVQMQVTSGPLLHEWRPSGRYYEIFHLWMVLRAVEVAVETSLVQAEA